jgi:hypothetical protein
VADRPRACACWRSSTVKVAPRLRVGRFQLQDLPQRLFGGRPGLAGLFARHGAPLALKCDNGPAFRVEATQACLHEAGVWAFYSPPACRAYNGAIEAGIGSLKTRTEQHAQSRGRLGGWTPDDLAAANHTPRGRTTSPADAWQARPPVTALECLCFDLIVQRRRFEARQELGIPLHAGLDHWHRSALDRQALRRALVEHGALRFTRRSIPLTLNRRRMANIT